VKRTEQVSDLIAQVQFFFKLSHIRDENSIRSGALGVKVQRDDEVKELFCDAH